MIEQLKENTKYNEVTLYKRAKSRGKKPGKIQVWSTWIEMVETDVKGEPKVLPCIFRKSGQLDGKHNTKKKFVKKGKNIGKSNETTPYEQALFECNNMIKAKIEENMVQDIDDIDNPPKYLYPALAIGMNEKKVQKLIDKYGYVYAQPKLNGARCWKLNHLPENHPHSETPTGCLISRKLKLFDSIKHIEEETAQFEAFSPDGEIFHPDMNFQQIISLLKKFYKRSEHEVYPDLATQDLQYHVYDFAIPGYTYEERKAFIDNFFSSYAGTILQPVLTVKVTNIAELDKYHDEWILQGYEGAIIRDPGSYYAFNDRNDSLIKYKKFYDDEFTIVDFDEEIWDDVLTGKMRKLVIWICETAKGIRFNSRPKGSFLAREKKLARAHEYIGKQLTVRYQELSEDGVPIMNVGMKVVESEGVRDYE